MAMKKANLDEKQLATSSIKALNKTLKEKGMYKSEEGQMIKVFFKFYKE